MSKGGGLSRAVVHLGTSLHNTIAVGDAENDLSLCERSELAVAVQNAVGPLRERAGIVLPEPDGAGVAELVCCHCEDGDGRGRATRTRTAARSTSRLASRW